MAKPRSIFSGFVSWVKTTCQWIVDNLGDPAISASIREDLGLDAGQNLSAASVASLGGFAQNLDPDQESFWETLEELIDVTEALKNFGDTIKADGLTPWDVAYLLGRVAVVDSLRTRHPWVHALGKLTLFVSDDPEQIEEFDPAMVVGLLRGDGPDNAGERILQRWMLAPWLVITFMERHQAATRPEYDDAFDFYYGWDPDPASSTPIADRVSARTLTLLLRPGDTAGATIAISFTAFPEEHQGPAVLLSFGGGWKAEVPIGNGKFVANVQSTGAVDYLIPLSDQSPLRHDISGDPQARASFRYELGDGSGTVAKVDGPGGSRMEIERLSAALELSEDGASLSAKLDDAKLVLSLSEDGDGFLSNLGGRVEVGFSLGFVADSLHGLRLTGGTQASASLPVEKSLFDVFTIHNIELNLGPSAGEGFAIDLGGSYGLDLGPFRARLGGMGLTLDLEIGDGNLGFADAALRFKPPTSVGLVLDAGSVKGGGYLALDPGKGEYSGVLELKVASISVKALGILTTQMPDGSDGWSLLLMIFGTFPPTQVGLGFSISGIGGVIGLQHGVSIPALESGLRTGVMNDVLFPKDPVADAQRIINQLKNVYPIVPAALTFGLMFRIEWGVYNLVQLRVGIVAQLDNALGPAKQGSVEFTRLVVLGRLESGLPASKKKTKKNLVKITVDFLGYYDVPQKRLGFQARLAKGSEIGAPLNLKLSGMVVVQIQFGDNASFVLAAGGFHPRYKDVPPGVPARIDRLAVKFKVDGVDLKLEAYFAIAPGAVQFGAKLLAKAKVGPVSFEGWLDFDAIFFDSPRFHFEVDMEAGVKVKFKGRTLTSVTLKMTLSGPDQWRAKGNIKFSVLFWDVNKSFDRKFGAVQAVAAAATNVAALLHTALSEPGNWEAQLPAVGQGAVSIGEINDVAGLLAHPTASLAVRQDVVPLGLRLERYGGGAVAGPDRFDIVDLLVDGSSVSGATPLKAPFAMSQFVEKSEKQRLTEPSFEKVTAGVRVSIDEFGLTPHEVAADLAYETHYLGTTDGFDGLSLAPILTVAVPVAEFAWQRELGASAVSTLRETERLRPEETVAIRVGEHPLAVVDPQSLAFAAELRGDAATSVAFARQASVAEGQGAVIVESFEVVGEPL